MQSIRLIVGTLIVSISPLVVTLDTTDLFDKADGCVEGPLEQFGRYIGD